MLYFQHYEDGFFIRASADEVNPHYTADIAKTLASLGIPIRLIKKSEIKNPLVAPGFFIHHKWISEVATWFDKMNIRYYSTIVLSPPYKQSAHYLDLSDDDEQPAPKKKKMSPKSPVLLPPPPPPKKKLKSIAQQEKEQKKGSSKKPKPKPKQQGSADELDFLTSLFAIRWLRSILEKGKSVMLAEGGLVSSFCESVSAQNRHFIRGMYTASVQQVPVELLQHDHHKPILKMMNISQDHYWLAVLYEGQMYKIDSSRNKVDEEEHDAVCHAFRQPMNKEVIPIPIQKQRGNTACGYITCAYAVSFITCLTLGVNPIETLTKSKYHQPDLCRWFGKFTKRYEDKLHAQFPHADEHDDNTYVVFADIPIDEHTTITPNAHKVKAIVKKNVELKNKARLYRRRRANIKYRRTK